MTVFRMKKIEQVSSRDPENHLKMHFWAQVDSESRWVLWQGGCGCRIAWGRLLVFLFIMGCIFSASLPSCPIICDWMSDTVSFALLGAGYFSTL